jgi:alpha,alpha-trehalase
MNGEKEMIRTSEFDAIVFDLDGVITDTASVHASAWKKLFDKFLMQYSQEKGVEFVPFDNESDYLDHVDGKPRYKGVEDFLISRGISLNYGDPDDPPEKNTICGLGNKKNLAFNQILQEEGVKVFDSTVTLIKKAISIGMKIGIISSSKNCEMVLKKAGLYDLFEARVDGVIAAKRGLRGKPYPDVFWSASEELGVAQERTVVVEDAISGVTAGSKGGFGLVIGIDRTGIGDKLLAHGADVVINDMEEVEIENDRPMKWLPSAIQSFDEIMRKFDSKRPVVFLDYDGTMTPIVERPEDAILDEKMKQVTKELSKKCIVGIVSGRDRMDVQKRVGLDNLYYAGSHGFDIIGPDGFAKIHTEGEKFISILDKVEQELNTSLEDIEGSQVERKKFSIATHYRRVKSEDDVKKVNQIVDDILAKFDSLKKSGGKKVIEIQPDIDWHKGKALRWLLQALKLDKDHIVPLYIGDDLTDENAFREIKDDGIAILVSDEEKETAAHYLLADTNAVRAFLKKISNNL